MPGPIGSNGGAVTAAAPTLAVHNATDLDKDVLTYEFELYSNQGMTNLVARGDGIAEMPQTTVWQVPQSLQENATYYWHSRAFDGALPSPDWSTTASFMVNTANDAPDAPTLASPAAGSSVATATPDLSVVNAADPDSSSLSYQFEIYAGGTLVSASPLIPEDGSGITTWTSGTLADNTVYQWRARATDGDSPGGWMDMASFTVHVPQTSINATVDFDPDTLNQSSKGTWVVVYIELPAGFNPADVDIASVRLEGDIPAESRPYCIGDHDKDGIPDLMVKFKRSDLINLLSAGDKVPVKVTGKVGTMSFEGVDVIRVIK